MRIRIITPAPPHSRKGNRVTALRWARILRSLGHDIRIALTYGEEPCDMLIALHAGRSFPSIKAYREKYPNGPLVVALTGTDLYDEIQTSKEAQQSLERATRLIVLQPLGAAELPEHLRERVRVIYQSVPSPSRKPAPADDAFEVCVLAHLRPVKDPFRTALAARLVPAASRLRVLHLGGALGDDMAERARAEAAANPRYLWLAEQPRGKALRILAGCRLLVLTSVLEGGANAVSEALAASVPVISSHIPGSIGLLGPDYPGYFSAGDTQALADLLWRAESDAKFYDALRTWCDGLKPLVDPARERQSWHSLLGELSPTVRTAGGLP